MNTTPRRQDWVLCERGTGILHALFERQVDYRGNTTALICGTACLSYAELEDQANHLAHYLRRARRRSWNADRHRAQPV
jgi:non-ribosomal peptide synthetase component F